jgi:hypothetical protein
VSIQDIADTLWALYEAEGKPCAWEQWLDRAKQHKPRKTLVALSVAFAYGR